MELPPEADLYEKPPVRLRRRRAQWSLRLTPLGVLVVFVCNLTLLTLLALPILQMRLNLGLPEIPGWTLPRVTSPSPTSSEERLTSATSTPNPPTPTPPPPTATATIQATVFAQVEQGMIVLALYEGDHSHLFAWRPVQTTEGGVLPLTRITTGAWDDLDPAVSPDGRRIAFVSNRNGYWDLYLLDLSTGVVDRITDNLAYEGAPAWSPDGLWLVYEAYTEDNLDLFIRSIQDPQMEPIRLTSHPGIDHSPAWSPQGRQIAFVSDRSGEAEIWLADLDQADESQFRNISRNPLGLESHPAWSPDGKALAWATVQEGYHRVMIGEISPTDLLRRDLGMGDLPVWSPDGKMILTAMIAPNQTYLGAYLLQPAGVVIPPLLLPGSIAGLDWANSVGLTSLQGPLRLAAEQTPTPLWQPVLTPAEDIPGGRRQLVEIPDVQVPYPLLQDLVDESFQALRMKVSSLIGWDFLGSLENAYVPLTAPLEPGMGNDWLYTGRAIAVNPALVNAGWMVVVREDFNSQTYWRVYLRARFQDGSAGMPLKAAPWDFNARFQGDPLAYEQGGRLVDAVPAGYWLDFTRLALAYGWERVPALTSWRSAYAAARFNEFVLRDGLDWSAAMLEIYPPEVLITPTRIIPPTQTPTATPRFFQSPTPSATSTPRPTLTPQPTAVSPILSRTPTQTPSGASQEG